MYNHDHGAKSITINSEFVDNETLKIIPDTPITDYISSIRVSDGTDTVNLSNTISIYNRVYILGIDIDVSDHTKFNNLDSKDLIKYVKLLFDNEGSKTGNIKSINYDNTEKKLYIEIKDYVEINTKKDITNITLSST